MEDSWRYEIRVEGSLAEGWSEWFGGMMIRHDREGETLLAGSLPDQAALFGVLNRIHDLNLKLIALCRMPEAR